MGNPGWIYDMYPGDPGVVDISGEDKIRVLLQFSPDGLESSVAARELAPAADPALPALTALRDALENAPPLVNLGESIQIFWAGQGRPNMASALQGALAGVLGADNFAFSAVGAPQLGQTRARAAPGDLLLLDFWVSPVTLNIEIAALITYPWTPETPTVTDAGPGGGLSAGTYRYAVTALDGSGGETALSGLASTTFRAAGHKASLTWPAAANAVGGYRVYRSKVGGPAGVMFLAHTVAPDDPALVNGVMDGPGWNVPQPDAIIPYTDSAPDSGLDQNNLASPVTPWMPLGGDYPLLPSSPYPAGPVLADGGLDGQLTQGAYRYVITALSGTGPDASETAGSPASVITFGEDEHTTNLSWRALPFAEGGYNIYRSLAGQPGDAVYLAGHMAQPEFAGSGAFGGGGEGPPIYYGDDLPDAGLNRNVVPPKGSQLPTGFSPPSVPWPLTSLTASVSVGLEFYLSVPLAMWPNATTASGVAVLNPSISPTGATHTAADFYDVLRVLTGLTLALPNALVFIFSAGHASVSVPFKNLTQGPLSELESASVPFDLSPLVANLAPLQQAAVSDGLLQCLGSTDPASGTPLTLTMVHPVDPPPVAYDLQTMAGPGQPLFSQLSIGTTQVQGTPAGLIGVVGNGFPSVYQMGIGWTDTCSGTVTGSDVEWGFAGSATEVTHLPTTSDFRFVPFARRPPPLRLGGQPVAGPLPGPYVFRVRNSDALTTTQYSDPVTLWSVGSVDLLLDYTSRAAAGDPGIKPGSGPPGPAAPGPPQPASRAVVVGTAAIQPDGTFSASVLVPPDAVPGPATLCAQLLGQPVFCVPVTIVTQIEPMLRLVNPLTFGSVGTDLYPASSVWVAGEGFVPQGTVTLYLDQGPGDGGEGQQAATVNANGTFLCNFTPPALALGSHTIIAVETSGEQSTQATLVVTEQSL
jgi:hypothetical protein